MPALNDVCLAAAKHYAQHCQLIGYDRVVPSPEVPCLMIVPTSSRYSRLRDPGGDDIWQWELWLLLARIDDIVDQGLLRRLVDGNARQGIPVATAWGQNSRGDAFGLRHVKARLIGVDSMGARFTAAGLQHLGAVLRLEVLLPAADPDQPLTTS